MRRAHSVPVLLACAALAGCDRTPTSQPAAAAAIPAPRLDAAASSTTFFTDFEEGTTGSIPPGWSPVWDPTPSWRLADDTLATGGRVLRWSSSSESRNRWGLAYGGFGDVGDQEVLAIVRVRSVAPGTPVSYMGAAAVRMGGTATDEQGYAVYFVSNQGARSIVLATWSGGGYVQLGNIPIEWEMDTWYNVRLQAVGGTIRVRVWPRWWLEWPDWSLEVQDSRWPVGRPGVANHDNGTVEWDAWSADVSPEPPAVPVGFTWQSAFAGDATGTTPAGWTATSAPQGVTWTVAADPSAADGRVLRAVATTTARHILRLDTVPASTTDQETLARFRMADADGYGPGLAVRHTMSGSSETAYVAFLRTLTGQVEINRFLNGGWGYVGSAPSACTTGQWCWMRFGASGPSLRVKVWPDGSPEPSAWTLQGTDVAIGSGSPGVYVYEPNTVDYDVFSVGTGGLAAPTP
jgi:hypothetical protein